MNLTRFEQQLIRAEQHQEPERLPEPPRPIGKYIMRFYNNQRQFITEHGTKDCHWIARNYEQHLIGTPLEYLVYLRHAAVAHCSYVDVVCDGVFVCRHFYRGGILSPLISFEPLINNDVLAKHKQNATGPRIDWSTFLNDAAWGRVSRSITIIQFKDKYGSNKR